MVVIESAAADQQPINVVYVMGELNRCLRRKNKSKMQKREKEQIMISFYLYELDNVHLLSADDVLCGGSCNGCAPNGTIGGPLRSSSSPFNRPAD